MRSLDALFRWTMIPGGLSITTNRSSWNSTRNSSSNVASKAGSLYTRWVEITYPREWSYRIIGTHEKLILQLVEAVMGDHPHTVGETRASAAGNYVAIKLTVEVRDQAHRDEIFGRLKADEAVKIVL